MDCCGIQDTVPEWDYRISEISSIQLSKVNLNIRNIVKHSLESFASQYNNRDNRLLLAVNWSEDAPYTQEEIDRTREASRNAKDRANQHIKNAWEALGNYNPGTVVRESVRGWNSLRESEALERESVRMENSNIDHYQNGRK